MPMTLMQYARLTRFFLFGLQFFISFLFVLLFLYLQKLKRKVIYFTEQWLRSSTKEIQERFLKIVLKQKILRNEDTFSATVVNFQGDSEFLLLLSCK